MRVHDERPVVDPKFRGTSDFYFDHAELVSGGRSASFDIEIYVFNVEHYELGESVARAYGQELLLPVLRRRDLVGAHGLDVHNVHAGSHLVNQD